MQNELECTCEEDKEEQKKTKIPRMEKKDKHILTESKEIPSLII